MAEGIEGIARGVTRKAGLLLDLPDFCSAEVGFAAFRRDFEETAGGLDGPGAQLLPGARRTALDLVLDDAAADDDVVGLRRALGGDVKEDLIGAVGDADEGDRRPQGLNDGSAEQRLEGGV